MTIDPRLTLDQLIQRYPAALPVLSAAGLDTCCGGGLPLREAAEHAGVGLGDLLRVLGDGPASPDTGTAGAYAGCGCGRREG